MFRAMSWVVVSLFSILAYDDCYNCCGRCWLSVVVSNRRGHLLGWKDVGQVLWSVRKVDTYYEGLNNIRNLNSHQGDAGETIEEELTTLEISKKYLVGKQTKT